MHGKRLGAHAELVNSVLPISAWSATAASCASLTSTITACCLATNTMICICLLADLLVLSVLPALLVRSALEVVACLQ